MPGLISPGRTGNDGPPGATGTPTGQWQPTQALRQPESATGTPTGQSFAETALRFRHARPVLLWQNIDKIVAIPFP